MYCYKLSSGFRDSDSQCWDVLGASSRSSYICREVVDFLSLGGSGMVFAFEQINYAIIHPHLLSLMVEIENECCFLLL